MHNNFKYSVMPFEFWFTPLVGLPGVIIGLLSPIVSFRIENIKRKKTYDRT
jgi:hypothetical protein